METLTEYLQTIGNSVVAFKTGSIVKVHVHTMDAGPCGLAFASGTASF